MNTDNPLLEHALAYAARAWRVVPVHTPDPAHPNRCSCGRRACREAGSAGKHPRILGWTRNASTDPDALRRWWRLWPDANIGIATGGGLAVLDVDPRHNGDVELELLEAEHGTIRAPTVRTGGGGLHLYFDSDLPTRDNLRPGLEWKAAGKKVVAPPSLHASGRRYEWVSPSDLPTVPAPVPPWLAALVAPVREVRTVRTGTRSDATSARYVVAAIERECVKLSEAPVGDRNNQLNRSAFALARFVASGDAELGPVIEALEIAAAFCGLEQAEIEKTLSSAFGAREVLL